MTSRPTLAALLRDLPERALVRFVAALYAARGATTHVEGNVVHVDGDRVLVASRWTLVRGRVGLGTGSLDRADRVVAVDPTRAARLAARSDAEAVSAVDLDRLARYGLDRSTADVLFSEWFERSLADIDPLASPSVAVESRPNDGPASTTARGGSLPPLLFGVALVAAVALVGVTFSGVGATTTAFPWVWDASDAVSVSTPVTEEAGVPSGADTETDTVDSSGTPTPTWLGANGSAATPGRFAPGVSTTGLTDVGALADAHAAALGNGSYRWELAYVESVDGTVTARGVETVRVDSRRRFVSRVDWRGRPVGFTPVASRPSYADGTVRYRPASNGTGVVSHALTDVPPAGEQGWRAARYLRWYLSTADSTVERQLIHTETPTAVVRATGTTYPDAGNYTVRAHVTSTGFVRFMSVAYTLAGREDEPPVAVRFSCRYHAENVSVSPPVWYTANEANRAG